MGVGVFSDDFDGTGDTFIVRMPYTSEEEFRSLQESGEVDAETDFETFSKAEYDDENLMLIEAIERVGGDLGLDVCKRKNEWHFHPEYATSKNLDDDFVTVISDDFLAAGWRSWETDLIVGIGAPKSEYGRITEKDYEESVKEFGAPPEKVAKIYNEMKDAAFKFTLNRLLGEGFECAFKTSGYTSSNYVMEECDMDDLAATVKQLHAQLSAMRSSPDATSVNLSMSERAEMIRKLGDGESWSGASLLAVPVYHDGSVALAEIPVGEISSRRARLSAEIAGMMEAELARLGSDAAPVPLNEATKAWFAEEGRYAGLFLVSEDEFNAAHAEENPVDFAGIVAGHDMAVTLAP